MFDNSQVVSITPTRVGTGGSKTGIPSMVGLAEIRDAKNVIIRNGRWENVVGGQDIVSTGCPTSQAYVYSYVYHTNTSPVSTTSEVIASGFVGPQNQFMRLTRNGVSNVATIENLSSSAGLSSFETIKERLYHSNGADKPIVYDGPLSLSTGSVQTYTWGIRSGPPITSITYDPSVQDTTFTFNVTSGNSVIPVVAGTIPASGFVGKTIWLNGNEETNPGSRFTITAMTPGAAGVGNLTVDPVPTFSLNPCTSQINYGNITWTTGGPSFALSYYDSLRAHTGNVGPVFTVQDYAKYNVNLIINFNGDITGDNARCDQILIWSTPAFTNGGNLQILSYILNANGALTYTDKRSDDSTLGIYLGPFLAPQFTNGMPLYFSAVAFWNGSVWGLAPTGPSGVDTVTVTNGGSGYTAATTVTFDSPPAGGTVATGFPIIESGVITKIVIANPGSGYVTAPNITIFDSGGGSSAAATSTLSQNFDLSLLFYSYQDDPSVLGRGEESWDPRNFLRIPAKDGAGLGLAVVGGSLIVQTERYLYTVTGSGPASYQLVKLSSKGFGVGQYRLTEYIGDATDSSSAMMFLGQDRVLWAQAPGSGSVNMSEPIQNLIDAVLRGPDQQPNYAFCRLYYLTVGAKSYMMAFLN